MNAYFVTGFILVAWAVLLTGLGLTRKDFPPTGAGLRVIVGITTVLVVACVVALLATTHKEHPREEAAKEKEEAAQEAAAGGGTIEASETEFKIALAGGNDVEAGKYTFDVVNDGQAEHDLAIEGGELKETKTPILAPGKTAKVTADLAPGTYKVYCTVPGHEQSGMKVDLTVE